MTKKEVKEKTVEINTIEVFSSSKRYGTKHQFIKGMYKAINIVEIDKLGKRNGKILIIKDEDKLKEDNIHVNGEDLVNYVVENYEYFSKINFVFSIYSNYHKIVNSRENIVLNHYTKGDKK